MGEVMEEDIKILSKFRNYNKFYKEKDGKLTITIDLDLKTELDNAIENLINRNKELEKENEILKKDFTDLCKLKNVIPKSKIKEKIEELEKEYSRQVKVFNNEKNEKCKEELMVYIQRLQGKIYILKEILQEGEKNV